MMRENVALVDMIIELLDARIPMSSRNPDIDELAEGRLRIAALNKADMADGAVTAEWVEFFKRLGVDAIPTDSISGMGFGEITAAAEALTSEKRRRAKARGRIFLPVRAMIVGIPNVGKSTFINKLTGRAAAVASDRPGVTRGRQWIKLREGFELLDTPGILWPNLSKDGGAQDAGLKLALTGAISDDILDTYTLGVKLIETLCVICPDSLRRRYKIEIGDAGPEEVMGLIGEARGFKLKGGVIDVNRAAVTLLDEFRAAKLGRISLETPL
jgi:ribosome biogenesis GTPase A